MGLIKQMQHDNYKKLLEKLCELKLEERRVKTDIKALVIKNKTIDFYQAQKLNGMRNDLSRKIKKVEAGITPNIIA
ncbi:MAG: hypothetical protein J5895_05205 [Alphaproteobacteria bacterium]|nr:hypothetical protein [Alphaproteobacteria bacterium]